MRYLLLSGSPRKGNTEYVLNKVFQGLGGDKEIVLLRNKKISRCSGCLYCDENKRCSIDDDMKLINEKLLNSDVIVIGSPNYFDNVSGLLKDFIDRTNVFYDTDKLKDKKVYAVAAGGGKKKNSKKVGEAIKLFSKAHKMRFIGMHCFKAIRPDDLEKDEKTEKEIDKIIKELKNAD